jgi:hypothetical protein
VTQPVIPNSSSQLAENVTLRELLPEDHTAVWDWRAFEKIRHLRTVNGTPLPIRKLWPALALVMCRIDRGQVTLEGPAAVVLGDRYQQLVVAWVEMDVDVIVKAEGTERVLIAIR